MGVQQGTVITVSAPGFASTALNTYVGEGEGFPGNTPDTPIEANLLPVGTWTWTSPSPLVFNNSPVAGFQAPANWKSNYVVGGMLQNLDETENITAELALTQTGPWTNSPAGAPTSVVATQSASIGPSTSIPIDFGQSEQDWEWFESATGIPTGPTSRYVSYSLAMSITDANGNTLNVSPPNLIVDVSVAPQKLTDDFIAQTAFDNFVIATAGGVIGSIFSLGLAGGILGSLAAGFQVLEQAEAAAAGDPPEPSLAFDRIERYKPRLGGEPLDH
jgi:hypothetical protein